MRRIFRFLTALAGAGIFVAIAGGVGVYYLVFRYEGDLPDFRQLATYEPPTMTRVQDLPIVGAEARQLALARVD